MSWEGCYTYTNPLLDATTRLLRELEREEGVGEHRMPQISGVEDPITTYSSENFFRVGKNEWEVHPVDDPELGKKLVESCAQAKLCLRDRIVVRMTLETGARIREILTLTVGDWRARGCNQEARACSKGSWGRRVKTIRFSDTAAKMLRQYINTDRAALDQELRHLEQLDAHAPLFLSQRRKPFDYEAFKGRWQKLCRTLNIKLRIHDLRHWYVSQAMRVIAETAKSDAEITLEKEKLVRYMAWRSPETLNTYDKYFKGIQHYPIQDQVHQRMEDDLANYVQRQSTKAPQMKQQAPSATQKEPVNQTTTLTQTRDQQDTDGWSRLLTLGGDQ